MAIYKIQIDPTNVDSIVQVEADSLEEARAKVERDIATTAARAAAPSYLDSLLYDYETGVRGGGIRSKLARADNFKERESVAENLFGSDGFTYNSRGQMALTPAGQKKLGLAPKFVTLDDGSQVQLNRIIDENSFGFKQGDLGDLAGITGPLVGALTFLTPQAKIFNAVTKFAKFFNGGPRASRVLASALGSATGKGVEEGLEAVQGLQEQEAGELAALLGVEAGIGAGAQFLGEAIGIGYGLLLGKSGPLDNLRLMRQGVQGRSLDDIIALDTKLGREATEAEIKKGIANGTIKVYEEVALPAQAAFGRNLPGRFQGLFEQVLGNQRSEKTKAYLFRELSELFKKINKDSVAGGELKSLLNQYSARTAMTQAQKASLDDSVKAAVSKVKTAEIETVKGLENYLKDVVDEFADLKLESYTVLDKKIGQEMIDNLTLARQSVFKNMNDKYTKVDALLDQSSSGQLMPIINRVVISPAVDNMETALLKYAKNRSIDFGDNPLAEPRSFNDGPFAYFANKIKQTRKLMTEDGITSPAFPDQKFTMNLVSLRNFVSKIKEEASYFLEGTDARNLASEMIDLYEGILKDLAKPGISTRLKNAGMLDVDTDLVKEGAKYLRKANEYSRQVLEAYDSGLLYKITKESKKGSFNANQVYREAVRKGKSDDLNDIFKSLEKYDKYVRKVQRKASNKTGELRNALKQKLMSDAYKEAYDPALDTIDFAKFATFFTKFDAPGVDRGKLQALLGLDDISADQFLSALGQINRLKPNIKPREIDEITNVFRSQGDGLNFKDSGKKFIEELEKLSKAKAATQALEGNLIISKLPEATTEEVVNKIFTPQGASNIRIVKETVGNETFREIQNNAMNKMLNRAIDFDGLTKNGDITKIFQAEKFQNILRSYGDETLEAMFGKEVARGLNNFAKSMDVLTRAEVGRGGSPGTLVAAAIAINSFNPALWPTIGGMAILRAAFQNPWFLKTMARTDKSAAVQLIEVFERMFRIGSIAELTRSIGRTQADLESRLQEQVDQVEIDQDTQNRLQEILQDLEQRSRRTSSIPLPDIAEVAIVQNPLPGTDEKSVFEREQELGFQPII